MARQGDPFIIKEEGGDIADRDVSGFSWRKYEGTTLGDAGVGTLKRVISQAVPYAFTMALLAVLLVLTARIMYVQVREGAHWRGVAEGNRIRLETLFPRRGLITDRYGRLLAYNVPSFRLTAVSAELPPGDVEREELLTRVLADVPTELLNQENLAHINEPSYVPQVLATHLPHDLALKLMLRVSDESGLRIEPVADRAYVGGSAIGQLLGYVGVLTRDEFEAYDGYELADTIGKAGVELAYEQELRGKVGKRQVEVDARGVERRVFAVEPPVAGAKLTLSVDIELQQAAYAALQKAVDATSRKGGSVVAMDPATGEVLALVSYPAFDPNTFTVGRDAERIAELLQDPKYPLYNRAIGGTYPSGSTIKPFVAAAALQEKVITPQTAFVSTGGVYAGSQFFADWKAGGHGATSVLKAIAESVNTFFYLIGGGSDERVGLGISRLSSYLRTFGFGRATGVDLPGEQAGMVPDAAWKQRVMNDRWYRGDTYNVSIGQGNLLVTPLQLAAAYASVATDGQLRTPRVAHELAYPSGESIAVMAKSAGTPPIDPGWLETVRLGMRQTVTSGSGRGLLGVSLPVAGKTGTAQTGTRTNTHAWFAGYLPADDPEFLLVVMVEEGGEGSSTGIAIAREIFNWYTAERAGGQVPLTRASGSR